MSTPRSIRRQSRRRRRGFGRCGAMDVESGLHRETRDTPQGFMPSPSFPRSLLVVAIIRLLQIWIILLTVNGKPPTRPHCLKQGMAYGLRHHWIAAGCGSSRDALGRALWPLLRRTITQLIQLHRFTFRPTFTGAGPVSANQPFRAASRIFPRSAYM